MELIYLLIFALLLLSTFGAHVIIMIVISASLIILLEAKQSMFAENSRRNVLLGILLLGLIMTSMLRVILLHSAR